MKILKRKIILKTDFIKKLKRLQLNYPNSNNYNILNKIISKLKKKEDTTSPPYSPHYLSQVLE